MRAVLCAQGPVPGGFPVPGQRLLHPGVRQLGERRSNTPSSANAIADVEGCVDVVLRQSHRAGEKLFVDYAGQSVSIVDPTTGEVRKAQIFVAVLGAPSTPANWRSMPVIFDQ